MPSKLSEGRRRAFVHSLVAQGAMLTSGGSSGMKLGLLDRNNMRGRMVTPIPDLLWSRILRAGDLREFHSRASAAWYVNNEGKLVSAAIGELRIGQAPSGAAGHALLEPAVTNKCTGYTANPLEVIGTTATSAGSSITGVSVSTAGCTVSIVDDSVELALAGLDQVCTSGKVYKVDSTGAAGNCQINFSGPVGNTNQHTVSGYLRGNDVTARFGLNNAFTGLSNETASYTRFSGQTAAAGGGTTMSMLVAANKVSYVILMQLEELGVATSPIPVAGSQVTRSADSCSIPTALNGLVFVGAKQGTIYVAYEAPALTTATSNISLVAVGRTGITEAFWVRNTSSFAVAVRDLDGNADISAGTPVVNTPMRQAFTWLWGRSHATQGWASGTLSAVSRSIYNPSFTPNLITVGGLLASPAALPVYVKEVRFSKKSITENEMTNVLVNG